MGPINLAVLVLSQGCDLDLIETKGNDTLACEKVFSISRGQESRRATLCRKNVSTVWYL